MSGEERLMSDDRQALIDTIDAAFTDPEAILDALLAVPVPLLREIAAATKPCDGWGCIDGQIQDVNGALMDCFKCHGSRRVPAVDRAALLAALGPMEPPEGWVHTAGFPKHRYWIREGATEWEMFTVDDHGAFS